MQRKIIHIDCDCYYAALEMRDFPHLRGKPMAVGGQGPRSVLSTCNYEARAFGIRSAMPTGHALSRCPQLIIQPHRFDVYKSVSQQIQAIFAQYSDNIEPLSLDEAFLDVTESNWFGGSATLLAEHIRQEVFQAVGITVSAGVAPNKFLAKVGSDWNKPNGCFVIPPKDVADFVTSLSVRKISGVGARFGERLKQHGIETCGDVQQWSLPKLVQYFGKSGPWLHQISRGIDHRKVGRSGTRKSLSIEHTFAADLAGESECLEALVELYQSLLGRLEKAADLPLKSLFVKVRFSDFATTTMERPWNLSNESFGRLFKSICNNKAQKVRLLGLGVRFNNQISAAQMSLWPTQ